jgi:hypothetical protein
METAGSRHGMSVSFSCCCCSLPSPPSLPPSLTDWLTSLARSFLAPDRPTHSEPARSTRLSCPFRTTSSPVTVVSFTTILAVKTECERDDDLLHSVAAV